MTLSDTVAAVVPDRTTPVVFGTAISPEASVPMKFPVMRVPVGLEARVPLGRC